MWNSAMQHQRQLPNGSCFQEEIYLDYLLDFFSSSISEANPATLETAVEDNELLLKYWYMELDELDDDTTHSECLPKPAFGRCSPYQLLGFPRCRI